MKKVNILNHGYINSDNDCIDEAYELLLKINDHNMYDTLINKYKDWTVTYALSEVRCDCVEWLPFSKNDKVLEIGSDCGNIVEMLAGKVGLVHCLETSYQKCEITLSRTSCSENVCVYLGGIEDFIKAADEKYDYIFLIGVFSQISDYFVNPSDHKNIHADVLNMLKPLLNGKGRIVIAEDNKLGLKYWNGTKLFQDDRFFSTLEGAESCNGKTLFTKRELNEMFAKTGFLDVKYFYPYPDYKFANRIYSDEYLPKIDELDNSVCTWEEFGLNLFNEARVFDSIIKENLFDVFSNSYVILLSAFDNTRNVDTLFVKYSNQRCINYRIKTEIKRNANGKKTVYKVPLNKYAKKHLQKMPELYDSKKTENSKLTLNKCFQTNNGIECEFINGTPLIDKVSEHLEKSDFDEAIRLFDSLFSELADSEEGGYFSPTSRFKRVFGEVRLPSDLTQSKTGNIDLILPNVIETNDGKLTVIDYEWTFDFPVPFKYILWRSVFYCGRKIGDNEKSDDGLWRDKLYEKYKISQELQKQFYSMELSFQRYVTRGTTPVMNMKRNSRNIDALSMPIQFYYDLGDGFNADTVVNSHCYIMPDGYVSLTVPLRNDEFKAVRIDPDSCKCMVKILSVTDGCGKDVQFKTNCSRICGANNYLFLTNDPQIIIDDTSDLVDKLVLEYIIKDLPNDFNI